VFLLTTLADAAHSLTNRDSRDIGAACVFMQFVFPARLIVRRGVKGDVV
jgi:hypothetical protein